MIIDREAAVTPAVPAFGVTRHLVGGFRRHGEPAPAPDLPSPWFSLDDAFVPRPPIA